MGAVAGGTRCVDGVSVGWGGGGAPWTVTVALTRVDSPRASVTTTAGWRTPPAPKLVVVSGALVVRSTVPSPSRSQP